MYSIFGWILTAGTTIQQQQQQQQQTSFAALKVKQAGSRFGLALLFIFSPFFSVTFRSQPPVDKLFSRTIQYCFVAYSI